MASAEWTWLLLDGSGNALGELTTATGKQIAYTRNSYVEAACTIGVDDAMATILNTAVASGWPRLQCWCRAVGASTFTLQFYGFMWPMTATAEVGSTLQLVARSPIARLLGMPVTIDVFNFQGHVGGLAQAWLQPFAGGLPTGFAGVPKVGLFQGTDTTPLTSPPAPHYPPGSDIGQAIIAATKLSPGFDFRENWVTGAPAQLATLDTMPALGSDKPNAKFEYGDVTMANLRSAQIITAPPVNYVFAVGANGLTSLQQTAGSPTSGSQITYGVWPASGGSVSLSSITDQATLDARSAALLRPNPVKTVQMTPDAAAPKPFDDYYLGDTVHVHIDRGSMQLTTAARVNAFTVVIDEEGLEQSAIPDPRTPEDEAVIRAAVLLEV